MARWFVVVWIVALVGGVSTILLTRPDAAPVPQARPLQSRATLNQVLSRTPQLVDEFVECRRECGTTFYKPGGLSNVLTVLDYSFEELSTSGECAERLGRLRRSVRDVSGSLADSSRATIRRFGSRAANAASACRRQQLPLRR